MERVAHRQFMKQLLVALQQIRNTAYRDGLTLKFKELNKYNLEG